MNFTSDGFLTWFYSEPHRKKYSPDHPAYLAAREAWEACRAASRDEVTDELHEAEAAIGSWLSAALDDPDVCEEMKRDIVRWFTAIERKG